jgi:large subunit ribosomal protein L21
MFAVIRTGGKQYRVSENACIEVERLAGSPGDTLTFDDVLMVGGADGEPAAVGGAKLKTAAVFAELLAQTRGDKVLVFKKKRRKNYRRMRGHRQDLTLLRITGISSSGEKPAAIESSAADDSEQKAPLPVESSLAETETNAPQPGEGLQSEAKE